MADVAWTQINTKNGTVNPIRAYTYEAVIDDTDTDTEVLRLNPEYETSIAIKGSADTYTVDVVLYIEDVSNSTLIAYGFAKAVGTVALIDYMKTAIGPITGIKFNANNAQASETATIQVIQPIKRSDA